MNGAVIIEYKYHNTKILLWQAHWKNELYGARFRAHGRRSNRAA